MRAKRKCPLSYLSSHISANSSIRYAEMDKAKKNTISHRYKALEKLRDYLLKEASS